MIGVTAQLLEEIISNECRKCCFGSNFKKGFLNNLKVSKYFYKELDKLKKDYPNIIKEIRGEGLLMEYNYILINRSLLNL